MTIEVQFFDDSDLPEKYLAYIDSEDHKGMVVQGYSVSDVLRKLSRSIDVVELYTLKPILG